MNTPFHHLSDSQWALVLNLMNWSPPPERGTPRSDLRKVWNSIFYVLTHGCRWIDLPREDEIEVAVLEADELWSYVGSKEKPQWLWLVMHSKTRQILAMQVGGRNKQTAEKLFFKLPEPLKKTQYYTDYFSVY